MSDARLDKAIDRAVREMLDVEPPAGLRGRVLDRIKQPRRGIGWMWIAAPVAAAAVIILAVLAPWRQPAPRVVAPSSPSIATVDLPPTVPPVTAPASQDSPKTVTIPTGHATPPGRQPASGRAPERIVVAAVLPAADASAIDPLSPIAPITVAPARPADIAPKEIAISPLAPIAELQIAPLSPPERRD
jgi:hypothetical protein